MWFHRANHDAVDSVMTTTTQLDQLDQNGTTLYIGQVDQPSGIVAPTYNLYEAKTRLSDLVDRAAAGEEIVIAKNGVPQARLVPLASRGEPRKPANAMRIRRIAADFDAPDPAIEALFGGETA